MKMAVRTPPALGGGQRGPNGTEGVSSPCASFPAGDQVGGQKGPRSIERSPCPPVPQAEVFNASSLEAGDPTSSHFANITRARTRTCAAALSAQQHRFLGLWLIADADRVRTSWQAQGRALGPVLDAARPPPDADAVLAYRLSDRGHSFKGAAELRCVLPIADLADLAGWWSVPLRALNDLGVALATAPGPSPLVGSSFKLEAALDRRFAAKASATGMAASDVLRGLVSRWVDGNEGHHD